VDIVVSPLNIKLGEPMLANKSINELLDKWERVGILHSKLIELSVILYRLLLAILLLDKEKGRGIGQFQCTDVPFGKMFFEKFIKKFLLSWHKGIGLAIQHWRSFSYQVDCMIPGVTSRKSLRLFFTEDLAKVMVFQWDLLLPGAFGLVYCFSSKSCRFGGLMNAYGFLGFVNEGIIVWFKVHICWKVWSVMLIAWMLFRIDEYGFAAVMQTPFMSILGSSYDFAFKGSIGPIDIGVCGG
jgi:hypothetical protein